MAWSTAIFLIVAMALTIPLFAIWSKTRRIKHSRGEDGRSERLELEVAELRDRVETLERIVTDKRYDFEQQFTRLENGDDAGSGQRGRGSP